MQYIVSFNAFGHKEIGGISAMTKRDLKVVFLPEGESITIAWKRGNNFVWSRGEMGHRHLQPGQTCAVNFEFWTARLGHRVFSKMDWCFHLGLFSCKNGDPKESLAFGFMDLSLMVCLWQRFEIENGQKSQFWHLQFSRILGFCQKHPIFKMSQFLKYPTNFQI